MTIDLFSLPPPNVIEVLDYEAALLRARSLLLQVMPEIVDVIDLESEPARKILEAIVYIELNLRARINDSARSNLLAFSRGGDLDHLAAFYGVERLDGELDDRLLHRVQLQIAALAGNGTSERYRAGAMKASTSVVDAAVLQPAAGSVDLALWIADGADVETALTSVRAAFAVDDARTLGVPLTVRQALAKPISVTARIYREASAPVDLAQQLAGNLPAALANYAKLGRDVPRSWLLAKLHVAGVSRVELSEPDGDVTMDPDEYATTGMLAITDGGVSW